MLELWKPGAQEGGVSPSWASGWRSGWYKAASGGGDASKRSVTTSAGGAVRKAAGGKSHGLGTAESEDYEEVVAEEASGKDKLVAEATQLLRSLRMKKLRVARLSKIGKCQSWGLLELLMP